MAETHLQAPPDRQAILERLLAAEPFRRADQLRRLLRYLIEQDELGRGSELTEYEIGRNALGRPEDFAPETDSSVRTRMHSLRQKLEEHYANRELGDEWRVEFPRGTYRPIFHPPPAPISAATPKPYRWWWAIAAVVFAVAGGIWWTNRPTQPLETLWRPMLESATPPALVVGQPVHVWVRETQGEAVPLDYPHLPDPLPNSKLFQHFIQPRVSATARLELHPSPNATLWGDAAGAALASKFLALRGRDSALMPESALKPGVALRGRPVIAFGRPEYSPAIRRYLIQADGYRVGMLNELRRYAIYLGRNPAEHYVNGSEPHETNYGLVTVMEDSGARVFVFSGITSDGSAAGVEYLSNSQSVQLLWNHLAKAGLSSWPRAFQVVLRITSNEGYPVAATYEKHLVLAR